MRIGQPLLNSRLLCAAVLSTSLSGCGGGAEVMNRKADREIYDKLVEIRTEFRKLRDDGASPAKWQQFEAKVNRQTAPMLDDLDQRAKASRKATQMLLFAARDYLPQMLVNCQTAPNEDEQLFDDHLEEARVRLGL